jgi:hypothetical protein
MQYRFSQSFVKSFPPFVAGCIVQYSAADLFVFDHPNGSPFLPGAFFTTLAIGFLLLSWFYSI